MDTSIQVAAMIVIASFVIDRVAGGVFFLLSMFKAWTRVFPDPATVQGDDARLAAQKRQKLVYYSFVTVLATAIVWHFKLHILGSLKLEGLDPTQWQDGLFSILVLVGGSDQIAALLKSPHAGKNVDVGAPPKPIEVTGRLTLDDGAAHATRSTRSPGD